MVSLKICSSCSSGHAQHHEKRSTRPCAAIWQSCCTQDMEGSPQEAPPLHPPLYKKPPWNMRNRPIRSYNYVRECGDPHCLTHAHMSMPAQVLPALCAFFPSWIAYLNETSRSLFSGSTQCPSKNAQAASSQRCIAWNAFPSRYQACVDTA